MPVKLYDIFLILLLLEIFCGGLSASLKNINRLNEREFEMKKKVESMEFISRSFRNTCKEKGFKSFNEWQQVCKNLWNLEYIAWAPASEFMEDNSMNGHELMYGKWTGKYGSGEVYCRK